MSHCRRFAKHRLFNHFMFNQNLRHETNLKVSMRVKGNESKTRELIKLVNDADFEDRLKDAVDNPMGDEARRITKKILPFLKIVGAGVAWSSFERSNVLTHLYAMNQFFGIPFLFITLSPGMRDSPLAMKMCCSFQEGQFQLPSLPVRTKIIADNPIIAARVFDRMMRAFFEIICGMPLDHFTGRKTNVDRLLFKNRNAYVGAFGRPKAIYAVIEDQSGGSLHLHGHLWGQVDQRVLAR